MNCMKKVSALKVTMVLLLLLVGFIVGFFVSKENKLLPFSCKQISYLHHDVVREDFNLNPTSGYSSDYSESQKEVNLRASELNALLFAICKTNPDEQESPSLEDIRSFKKLL